MTEKEQVESTLDIKEGIFSIDDVSENEKTLIKSPEEIAFIKKLNWKVMPLVFLVVFIQFCDKSALSVAAVLGIMEDANLSGSNFSWLGSIFYLGYLVCQLPNNYLIQRLPIARYLGSVLVLWGCVMGATAACNTYRELLAMRFLLGLFEGVTYPCIYLILNTLYRRSEQTICWGFVGGSAGAGSVLGVAIAYGLAHMDLIRGLRAWRWGYIVFGIATVVIGISVFFFLIDEPHHRLLHLTEKEKDIIEERARDNCVVRVKVIKKEQMWEAAKEPRLWLLMIANTLNCLQNGGLVTFSTLLVQGLGFSPFTAIILQIPNGAAAAIFALGSVLIANKTQKNTATCIGATLIALVGCILMAALPGTPKLLGFYLTWAMTGTSALIQSLVSNNVSGYTKRVFYNAIGMVAMTIGNFVGPLMMTENQAPSYIGAMVAFSVSNVIIIGCVILVYIIMKRENNRRIANPPASKTNIYLDLTDKQDRNIIYKL